jgi:hypothetical protein
MRSSASIVGGQNLRRDFVEVSAERVVTIALAFDPEVPRTRREY